MTNTTPRADRHNAILAACMPLIRIAAKACTDRDVVVVADLESNLGRIVAFRLQPASSPSATHLGPLVMHAPMADVFEAIVEGGEPIELMFAVVGHIGTRVVIASEGARAFALESKGAPR